MAEVRRQRGFTLVEMLVAIGILVLGVTSLIGFMSVGVSTRASSEVRGRAVYAVDRILHHLETEVLPGLLAGVGEDGEDGEGAGGFGAALELSQVKYREIPGYPGLTATVTPRRDETVPGIALLEIRIAWLEEGAEVSQVFWRAVPEEAPFPARVARDRERP